MKSLTSFLYSSRLILIIVFFIICFFVVHSSSAFAMHTGNDTDHVADIAANDSGWIDTALSDMVLGIAMGIGGLFTTLGGVLLNGAISQTILNAGWWLGSSQLGIGIREMWVVVRDIFNIVFIFAFIYIGIKTILNADDSGAKRSLGLLIVAALLINFSLYFAQVIIDFSNIAAVQIYNQITLGNNLNTGGTTASDPEFLDPNHSGIVGAFFDIVNISSLLGDGSIASLDAGQTIIYAIMMMFFLIIAGIVCGMGGILLIRRFISLVISLILSPIMFAGWIFPAFMGYQEKWRKKFLEQAFFAPAFLFMLYLSLFVLGRMKEGLNISNDAGYGSAFDGSSFAIFLFFCIAIGFLYASIKVGEMMSIAGASGMASSLKTGGKYFSGAAQSLVYRNTAGRGLNWGVKQLDKLDQAADKGNRSARFLRAVGVDESVRRSVEGASNKGINGGRGREAVEKDQKTASERTAQTNAAISLKTAIAAGNIQGASDAQKIAMESALAGASVKDLEKMAQTSEGFALIQKIAGNLPEKKFESLMESKELDPEQKAKLGAGRITSVKSNIANAGGIKNATVEQLNGLSFEELMDHASEVQSSQLDKLEGKWGDEKMRIFKEKRKKDILAEFDTNAGNLLNSRKGEKEIAKLPTEIFQGARLDTLLNTIVNGGTTIPMSGGLIETIAREGSLTGGEKKILGQKIINLYNSYGTTNGLPEDIYQFFKSGAGSAFGVKP